MTSFSEIASQSFAPVPESWLQGRTLFGGASVAYALGENPLPLRSLQANFVAPISDAVSKTARVLREGRSATFTHTELVADDQVALTLSAVFGPDRESGIVRSAEKVETGNRDDGIVFPYIPGVTPEFTQNFSYVLCSGDFPFMNSDSASFQGWCRHKTEAPNDVRALLGLIDAWPCPALALLRGPAPASSVNWSVAMLESRPTYDGWFWFESDAYHVADGFVQMQSTIYDSDGIPLATSHQLVAIFA